jgi:hypothetical protein
MTAATYPTHEKDAAVSQWSNGEAGTSLGQTPHRDPAVTPDLIDLGVSHLDAAL